MSKGIEPIKITDIFNEEYIIPIYQRKYAWTNTEIEQLLEDIAYADGNYYLGTLTVDKKEDGSYEVIDGQQRLITLYLLMLCLKLEKDYQPKQKLKFKARKNYDVALSSLEKDEMCDIEELNDGYKCIKAFLSENKDGKNNEDKIKEKLTCNSDSRTGKVFIVRVQVPEETDLNNYFEIMNTRGEQLELYHIAKAKFLEALDEDDRNTASIIWDACANMDTHVQKNLKTSIINKFFSNDVFSLKLNDLFPDKTTTSDDGASNKTADDKKDKDDKKYYNFKSILEEITKPNTNTNEFDSTFKDIANQDINAYNEKVEENGDEDEEKYKSIIPFPHFLLYVNAVLSKEDKVSAVLSKIDKVSNDKEDYFLLYVREILSKEDKEDNEKNLYDDKKLLQNLKQHFTGKAGEAKKFIYYMLLCRFLFDNYVVKRSSSSTDDNLKLVLKKYKSGGTDTFPEKNAQECLITLQSILQITYTSYSNKQWITVLLTYIIHKMQKEEISLKKITNLLESYCKYKIKEHYKIDGIANIEDFNEKRYNDIERIVFTYLDYILWRDGYEKKKNDNDNGEEIIKKHFDWKIKYRNSIEHFFARSLVPKDNSWKDDEVDCFGNLALVSPSDNAKLSNFTTGAKVEEFKGHDIIIHNPKLKIMASYIKNGEEWTPEKAQKHQEEMFKKLAYEINRKNSNF